MKKLLMVGFINSMLLFTGILQGMAQQTNIATQPLWGPEGYDKADHYYLPDVESYYNVATHQFIYLDGGRWIFANKLPPKYAHYDLYSGYKVVINRPRPYLNFSMDRVQYAHYGGHPGKQISIRDTRNPKYRRHVAHNGGGGDYGP